MRVLFCIFPDANDSHLHLGAPFYRVKWARVKDFRKTYFSCVVVKQRHLMI